MAAAPDTLRAGYRRARYLMLLSRLPAGDGIGAEAARYMRSRNRYVRFYALMTQLAAEPATSLRRMAEYDYPFSACEVSEIMAMLRRGLLPIAYEPLVGSPNRNLRMVGLGIVRQFGIEEAERLLLAMVAREKVPELGREALYTLCSMRCSLRRREVAGRIASMSRAERKALMRYMAREGYAPAVLRGCSATGSVPTTNRLYIPINGVWYADRAVTAACRCRRCGPRAALAGRAGT
ncbi:MAG: hypothetical protein ACLR3T_02965 [Alistipes finegoldii]